MRKAERWAERDGVMALWPCLVWEVISCMEESGRHVSVQFYGKKIKDRCLIYVKII